MTQKAYIKTADRPLAYQENMLTGRHVAEKIFFGVGAASLELQTALYEELDHDPYFTALELPANFSDFFSVGMRRKLFERYSFLQTGSLAPLSLLENMIEEKRLQEEFIKGLQNLLEGILQHNVKKVFLNFPMELILGEGKNPDALLFLEKILKALFPVLLRGKGELLLPYRIPALPAGPAPCEFAAFIGKNRMSNIKASLQIHPHEIPREGMDMELLLGTLALDTGSISFRYDAENGHMLVKGHMAPFLQYLLARGYKGGCFVIPLSNGNRLAPGEIDRFSLHAASFLGQAQGKKEFAPLT